MVCCGYSDGNRYLLALSDGPEGEITSRTIAKLLASSVGSSVVGREQKEEEGVSVDAVIAVPARFGAVERESLKSPSCLRDCQATALQRGGGEDSAQVTLQLH